jgi:hypothetical protein
MDAIPDASNFFAALHRPASKAGVGSLFRSAGWKRIQPDDWPHLEVRCPFAELVIESDSPVLLHGPVDPGDGNPDKIVAILKRAGLPFTAELYAEDHSLIREWRSPDPPAGIPVP